MDKIQIMNEFLTRITLKEVKERNYVDMGIFQIKNIAVDVFEKNQKELIYMFFDDIIDEITKLGNITQEELLHHINYKFGWKEKSIKTLKEPIIKRLGFRFLLQPINYLIYWDSTKQGYDYWEKKNLEYMEKLTYYNTWKLTR